ncbi:hypothetical protein QR680_003905 [Steinernema hermaphroditum]|uniref:F-box domain-containing protein n=1 Tax=Steinernema hermaphroditum TaxID=289476 RepID=A0AA39HP97_9BILA|nr:hypothetical protein QR680_003905 [Steinernema hermaphroditum]
MDFLPHALVDHIVDFLPLNDVKTIVKATVGNRDLAMWNRIAEEHLRERYLLDVNVYLEEQKKCDEAMHGFSPKRRRLEDEHKNAMLVQMYIEKRLFGRASPLAEWDFKNWRHAWLGKVAFHSGCPRTADGTAQYPQADPDEIVRVISLPVATKNETKLPSSLCFNDLCPHQLDPALNMADFVQKTFTALAWNECWDGSEREVDDFLCDYLDREAFLEELVFNIEEVWKLEDGPLSERIVELFKTKNSLKVAAAVGTISVFEENAIVTRWKRSNGMYRGYKEFYMYDCWWRTKNRKMGAHGYFVHRSKRSSLYISETGEYMKIVKFQPWHEPVSAQWMDSLIEQWKRSQGFYIHRGERKMNLLVNDEEWGKFIRNCNTFGATPKNGFSIEHSSHFATLEISRGPETLVTCEAKRKKLSGAGLRDFIAEWEKGNGHFLVDQSRRIEVEVDYPEFMNMFTDRRNCNAVFINHPRVNARLEIKMAFSDDYYHFFNRITVVPIDPEEVEDWNLDLLFGRQ